MQFHRETSIMPITGLAVIRVYILDNNLAEFCPCHENLSECKFKGLVEPVAGRGLPLQSEDGSCSQRTKSEDRVTPSI